MNEFHHLVTVWNPSYAAGAMDEHLAVLIDWAGDRLPVRRLGNDSSGFQDVWIRELIRGHNPGGDPKPAVSSTVQVFVVPLVREGHSQANGGQHAADAVHPRTKIGVSGHQHQTVRPSRMRQLEHLHRDGNVSLLFLEALHGNQNPGKRQPQLPTLSRQDELTPGKAGTRGLLLEPGKGKVNTGVLEGVEKGSMPADHIGPLEVVSQRGEIVHALQPGSRAKAAGNQGGAKGAKVEPTERSKVRGPLGCPDGVVEVEPIHEEGDSHRGRGKEKAPGPWPRGTRETAVFGGDSPSTINPEGPEGKPKARTKARKCPSGCLATMGYNLSRFAGHLHGQSGDIDWAGRAQAREPEIPHFPRATYGFSEQGRRTVNCLGTDGYENGSIRID